MDAQALGRYLRQSRETRELTLEDAESALHIRRRILESFELGDFQIADSSAIQIRGFLRNYARYLGLDEDRVIQYYEAANDGGGAHLGQQPGGKYANRAGRKKKKRETQPAAPVAPRSITDTNPSLPAIPATGGENRRSGGSLLAVIFRVLVGGAALAVIIFVVVQLVQGPDGQGGGLTAPDILGELPPSPSFTPPPTSTPVSLLPTPLPDAEAAAGGFTGEGVFVVIDTTQRTYLRIITDGVEQFNGLLEPETHIEIPAQENVTLSASNADALEVVWNGREQGSFGRRGQRVDIVFTPTNVEVATGSYDVPTSEFSPTPLPTSPVDVSARIAELTPTSTPGPSPTPSDTPVPSDTPAPTDTPSLTPTITSTPTITLTPSNTPTATRTPTITPTPTITLTPSPTAILPPRATSENPTPTKEAP